MQYSLDLSPSFCAFSIHSRRDRLASRRQSSSSRLTKRPAAYECWKRLATQYRGEALATAVGEVVGVPASQVSFWSSYYDWSEVCSESSGDQQELEDQDIDYADRFAHDPLEDFYVRFRTKSGSRRHVKTFLDVAGFANPSDADLSLYQHILNTYPITTEDAALALGQSPRVFPRYAAVLGCTRNRKLEAIAIPIGFLVQRHPELASHVVKNANDVYFNCATPIRTLAARLNMRWTDLWVMGARYGEWVLPSPERLKDIEQILIERMPVSSRPQEFIMIDHNR